MPRSAPRSSSSRCGRQLLAQVVAHLFHVIQKARLQLFIDHRQAHRAHQRVAVVGAALVAVLEHAHSLLRQQRRQGHAAADALAQGHDVRLDAEMLVAEQGTETPEAGLHFVADQQQLLVVAQLAQLLHERRRCRQHTAFTLHGLEHHRHSLVGRSAFPPTPGHSRFAPSGSPALAARRSCPSPACRRRFDMVAMVLAVKAVVEGDDLVGAASFLLLSPFARQLDRAPHSPRRRCW